jgi:hypothetical protein
MKDAIPEEEKGSAGGVTRQAAEIQSEKPEALVGKTFEVLSAENRAARTNGSGIQRRTA